MAQAASERVESVQDEENSMPWKLVVHYYPDTDAWSCLWAASRLVVPPGVPCEICFVDAGLLLPHEDEEGYNVLYMDTGHSDTDQHGKNLLRSSSCVLLAQKYGLDQDPALRPILDLTVATDNIDPVSYTSIHYVFKGLPHFFKDLKTNQIDWFAVKDQVFDILDIIYSQGVQRVQSAIEFKEKARIYDLPNGLRVASILWAPHLREAAYDAGCDAVLWTISRGKKRFEVGIQLSRKTSPRIHLRTVVGAIRSAEARKRELPSIEWETATSEGMISGVPGWFLHDSGRLVLCGSRSHKLQPDDHTVLEPYEILGILKAKLGNVPRSR